MGEDAGGFVFFWGGKARRVEGYLVEKIHEMLCLFFFLLGEWRKWHLRREIYIIYNIYYKYIYTVNIYIWIHKDIHK